MSELTSARDPTFKIIACVDSNRGIGKDGKMPWHRALDMHYFAKQTNDSVVIMGRLTYESIGNALPNRVNIVVTTADINGVITTASLHDALILARAYYIDTFVIGGGMLYTEAIAHPLCAELILTRIDINHNCDVQFPRIPSSEYSEPEIHAHPDNTLYIEIYTRINQSESAYLNMTQRALDTTPHANRTSVGTRSLFAESIRYPLVDGWGNSVLPLLTTKHVPFRLVYEELLWFLSGGTTTDYLKEKNVNIWDGNSSREFLTNTGLAHYREGELGPVYGHQWRRFNKPYTAEGDGSGGCVSGSGTDTIMDIAAYPDQIKDVIEGIKSSPHSRRHVVSAWNPQQLDQMALPPCHLMFIFHVDTNGGLSCHLIMRSNDLFLGHPFNVASYAALTHMIAKICGLKPNELVLSITNAHVYETHVAAMHEQITRKPYGYPAISFSEKIADASDAGTLSIDDFASGDVIVEQYANHGRIMADMVV